jgi:hypothetical protein
MMPAGILADICDEMKGISDKIRIRVTEEELFFDGRLLTICNNLTGSSEMITAKVRIEAQVCNEFTKVKNSGFCSH